MDKKLLRKLYLEKRLALDEEEISNMNNDIAEKFSQLDFSGIKYLHLFYPIPGKKEVDSLKIAKWLRINHPQIRLVLSKSDFQSHSLHHILWNKATPLALNSWGITEPLGGEEVNPKQLDMVLIPLLAYDMKGNRVGYGKGFYDRFLAECREDALKIGLSFFNPEPEISDAGEHDIPLDICITPEQSWKFGHSGQN